MYAGRFLAVAYAIELETLLRRDASVGSGRDSRCTCGQCATLYTAVLKGQWICQTYGETSTRVSR